MAVGKEVIEAIQKNITKMEDAELMRIRVAGPYSSFTTNDPDIVACAERYIWREAPELIGKLPPKWCPTATNVSIRYENYDVELPKTIRLAPGTSSYFTVHALEAGCQKFIDTVKESNDQITAVRRKYKEIKAQITAYLKASVSLASALKSAPEITLYVPEQYKPKPKVRGERKVAEDVFKPALDRELLAVTAVTASLVGGNDG